MLAASTALAGLFALDAAAGPQDGQVVAGQAAIQQPGGGRTNVIQTTDRAVIDWRSFSIGAGEHVDFQQPGAGSVTLNRVTGSQSSLIDGRLTATGNVFIVNPNGVIFGKGASVDVGGLVATTTNLSNANFMAGRFLFDQPSSVAGASVVNEGSISVREGGLAALVAPTVRNSGTITARLGRVVLAGAETATVDLYGDGLLAFDTGVSTAVTHDGAINADGGSVVLTTAQAKGLVDGAISMGGTITARSVEKQGGKIVLKGAGSVSVAGTLDASGKDAGATGGEVKVLGDTVALQGTARVDVSGDQGGGTALIGGNVQGQGPEQRAANTLVSGGALISADAISAGKGGSVVVWADNHTQFDGAISARGGAKGGDGGFVETSGKQTLGIKTGKVDASAAKGKGGQWLLDPRNVVIADTTAGDDTTGGTALSTGTFTPNNNDAVVDASVLGATLSGGTSVTITTGSTGGQDGDITTTAGVTWTGSATLTLNAARDITLSQDFVGTAGSLSLIAGRAISQTGGVIKVANLSAGAAAAVSLARDNEIGTLGDFSAGGNFTLNDTTGGLTVTGDPTSSTGGLISIITTGGALTLQGSIAGTGVELRGSGISIAAAKTVNAGGGAVVLDAGAGTLSLGAGTLVLGTSSITLRADDMAIDAAAQIGGSSAGTGSATMAALTGSTAGRSIGIAGGSGDLALSADELATIRAGDVAIGSADAGAITFGAWTPASTFASGTLTVTGNAGVSLAGAVTLAGDLVINPGGAITQSGGALTVAGNTTINAAGFDVTLDQAGNDFQGSFAGSMAALTLKGGAISFATLSAASIAATTTGAVTQTGDLTVSGDTTISAGSNAVTLDRAGNDFQGTFGGSAGALTLKGGAISFATLSAALIDATTTGAITQTGNLTVTGAASFDTGSNDITLSRSGNDFQDAVSVTGGTVSVTDTNALSIGGSTGALTLSSGALSLATLSAASVNITATGAITQTGDLTFSGSATITAGSNAVTLDRGGNDFQAALSITGGTVAVVDQNALTFGGSTGALSITSTDLALNGTTASSLSVAAGGAVTQNADITVSGATSIAAGSNDITLSRSGNSFGGSTAATGGAVSIGATGALTLGPVSATSLVIATTGTVEQTGGSSITVTGTTNVNAGSGAVTLTDSNNNFTGAVTVTGAAVSLTDSNTLSLGAVSASSLTVQAGGTITQASGTSISAAGGAVSLNTSAGNITLRVISAGRLTATTTGTGLISQAAGALTVTGTSSFTTGSGNISLGNGNNFTGAVSASTTGNVTIRDAADLVVGNISANNLTLTSAGAQTQAAGTALDANGTTSLTAGSGAVTLANAGNTFDGTVSVSTSGAISLRDADALTVSVTSTAGTVTLRAGGALSLTGAGALALGNIDATDFSASAAGAVTQTAGTRISASGATSITTSTGAVTLHASANTFGAGLSLSASASDATVAATGDIAFGAVSVASLDVTATGALSQASGSITVTGTTKLTAGAITLDTASNNFGGTVTVTGSAVSLADAGALSLGDVDASSLTISATGALTQAAGTALQITGTSSLDAGSITLANATNSFGNTVTVDSGAAASLAATGNLRLGTVGATTLAVTAGSELRLTGDVTTTGTVTLTGTSFVQTGGADIAGGSGAVTITADSMSLGGTGSIATSGAVTLRTRDTTRNIRLGSTAAGSLSLSDNDLNALSGASGLTIGQAGGTGTITVAEAINLTGNAGNLTLSGGAILLGQSITTSGNITFGAAATLTGGSTVTLTGTAGSVALAAGVEGTADGAETLVIKAGNAVTLGAVGATVRLASLDVSSGSTITMAAGTATTGVQTYTGTMLLSGDSSFSTGNANFTVTGGIRGTGAGGQDLSIAIGTGALSVGTIGAGTAVGAFSASAASLALTSIAATGDVTLTANSGGVSVGTLSHGSGNVLITADSIDLTGIWTGSGTRTIQPRDVGRGLSIGAAGAAFDLTATELSFLGNGSPGSITIGRADGTGAVSITPFTFDDTLSILGGNTTLQSGTLAWTNSRTLTIGANGSISLLGGITGVNGSLVLQATGSITQTKSVFFDASSLQFVFTPTAPVTVGALSATAGSTISLDGTFFGIGNTVTGRTDLAAGGAISYLGAGALTLGTVSGASLAIAGVSSIGQVAGTGIVVTGATSFGTSGAITLAEASNDFGTVSTSGVAGAVTLRDANALVLGGLNAASLDLTVGGALTQTGDVTVTSTTRVTSNTSAITLNRTSNNFGGAVSIATGGGTALADQNDLLLGNVGASSLTVVAQGSISQAASTALTIAGATGLSAATVTLANSGNDFTGAVSANSTGAISLRDANALVLGTSGAASLTLVAAGTVTQTGNLTVTGTTSIAAGSNAVTLDRAGNDFQGAVTVTGTGAAVTLTDKDALVLGTTSAATLTLTTGGPLTQIGDLTVTGTTSIAAGSSAVTLDRSGNNFTGAVSVAGGTVSLRDGSALILGTTTAASLNLTTGGALTQTGDITVTGTTSIAAGSSAVTLANAGNDFGGDVSITGGAVTIADANALRITGNTGALSITSGALTFGALTASSLTVTAAGEVSQDAAIAVTGTSTINAGANAVELDLAGNNFQGAVALTGGAVRISDADALVFGISNVASLAVVAGGNITQTGNIGVTGASSFDAGSNTITLTRTGNNFGGAVTIAGGSVSITDIDAFRVGGTAGALTLVGSTLTFDALTAASLTVTTSGAVSQNGALTISGAGNVSAGSGAVTLANAGNDFAGGLAVTTSGAVSITDGIGGLALGTTSTGALTLTVNGALTQTGDITASGVTVIAASGADVTLTRGNNDFQAAVSIAGGAVLLTDKNALVLGTVAVTSLSVTAGGAITQTGDLAIGGVASFVAGNNDVTLNRAGNDFAAAVSVTGKAVSLRDQNALVLGALTATSLTLQAGGDVSQTGIITVSGASSVDAGANAIALDLAGNNFQGAVSLTGGAVSITDANALSFGTTSAASLVVLTGGPISQTGDITVAGTSSFDAGTSAITLSRAGNDFGGAVAVNGGSVSITDTNALRIGGNTGALVLAADALTLDTLTAASLTVTAGGAVTQTGALSIAGTTSITAGSNTVVLENAGNDFAGVVNVSSTAAVRLVDAGALTLGSVAAASLDLAAAGNVTQTGALTVSGMVNVSATGFDVVLANTGNVVGGFAVIAASADLRDKNATGAGASDGTRLGTSTVTGDFSLQTQGAVTQTGTLDIGGTTTIKTNAAVTLEHTANRFGGALDLEASSGIMVSAGGLTIARAKTTGALALTGTGIAQTGRLEVGGSLTLDAMTGAIVLADTANAFGTVSIAAGNAVIAKASDLNLGAVNTSGDLTVIANGAITQSGAVKVGGTANFTAVAGKDITLTHLGNDFATFTAATARNISVADDNGLILGPISASGTFNVKTGGALTQTAALAAATLTGDVVGDATLDRTDNVIATLGPFTATGSLAVASSASTFSVSAAAKGGNGVSLIAAATAGTLSVQSTAVIDANGKDVLLQGDDIQLAAAIGGTGDVTLQSTTASRNITVGAAVNGELSLTQDEINLLGDGHRQINIGRADGSGRIDIRSALFVDPVRFRSPAAGGSVRLNGTLQGQGNASFEFLGSGATTTLNGSILTDGQDIVFNDAVVLGAGLAILNQPGRLPLPTAILDTTGGGRVATGGDVMFMSSLDSAAAFTQSVDIYAGTQGKVVFEGDIGATTAVGRLRVFSGASFTADVGKVMTRILDIEVTGLALARNVTATEELLLRGVSGTADLTLSSVRGNGDAFAAFFVRRPDGISAGYTINGCVMATTCGMDMVFLGVSLPPYRDDPDVGTRSVDGSLGSPAMRSPRILSASVQSPNDDFSIQYSSPADRELW